AAAPIGAAPGGGATKGSTRPSSLPPGNPFDDPFALTELDFPGTTTRGQQKTFTASFPGFERPRPAAPAEAPKAPSVPPSDFPGGLSEMDPFDAPLASAPPPSEAKGRGPERTGAQYGEVDLGGGSDTELDDGAPASSGLDTDDGM